MTQTKNKKFYIGLDLSTAGEDIGCCVLSEIREGVLELTSSPLINRFFGKGEKLAADLVSFLSPYCQDPENSNSEIILAIDVPFGWPNHFSDAVSKHQVGQAFGQSLGEPRDKYKYRSTDRFVMDVFQSDIKLYPLSVSTDRLGITAMFGSELLETLVNNLGFAIDIGSSEAPGSKRRIIEVYPKASLVSWNAVTWINSRNQTRDERFHQYMTAVLQKACPLFGDFPVMPTEFRNWHHLDAFICALTARDYSFNHCYRPESASYLNVSSENLQREGWIWLPTRTQTPVTSTR